MSLQRVTRWIVPILVLPFTVIVLIPSAIYWGTAGCGCSGPPAAMGSWKSVVAILLGAPGVFLSWRSGRLFFLYGEGTAAPWDPPQRLVIRGPYRFVRNPMITGVILMLSAEAFLFQSMPIGAWAAFFFLGNAIYFPLVEEPGLVKRFGEDYKIYAAAVPRWVPRLRPWESPGS